MKNLVIDTATEFAIIAIFADDECIEERILPFGIRHSKELMPALSEMFKDTATHPDDLHYVVTGIGPGSYTGIRVGAVTGKMIAYSLRIPLIGVTSLMAYAPTHTGLFATLFDARVGGAYWIKGYRGEEGVRFIQPPSLSPLIDLPTALEGIQTIVTPHLPSLQEKWAKTNPHHPVQFEEMPPTSLHIGKEGYRQFKEGNYSLDGKLNLLYLRKTQAEIEKES